MREQNEKIKQRRLVSCHTFYLIQTCRHLTPDLRMLQQTRTHSSRRKRRNDSDRRRYEKCRRRSIVHASRMLSEKWTRFRVGSGIPKKRQSGGRLPSPNSQQQPRQHQLHKQIPEMVKQNPHLLRSNLRVQVADEERGGVAGAVDGGEVEAETNRFLLAMIDYIIH